MKISTYGNEQMNNKYQQVGALRQILAEPFISCVALSNTYSLYILVSLSIK